jgi:hypothetical protein
MKCRHCETQLKHVFLDLGFAPASNDYLTSDDLRRSEIYNPLRLFVCDCCWLVQTDDYKKADDLFTKNYAYFSSTSRSWLDHAKKYCDLITKRLGLNQNSLVIEVASNDGYLLKNFVEAKIPCLGIEPTDSTAEASEKLGIPVIREFFGSALAVKLVDAGQRADLICGNNVYAHVPDINDFTAGLAVLLKDEGTVTLEFPHLMQLLRFTQFDTVYHEHFSYLSLHAVEKIFALAGLRIYDVEELPTHGGSLRVYGCKQKSNIGTCSSVQRILDDEAHFGLTSLDTYRPFQKAAEKVKDDFLAFLLEQKKLGKTVAAYGAAAKGNTLLNFAGIKTDLISFVCDAALAKQEKYLPGSHIPIVAPDQLALRRPDWVIILPWNIADEIVSTQSVVRSWGGRFVRAVPHLEVLT